MNIKIAERLKKLRGNKTQTYTAEKIGINRQTYCNYENGSRQADYETLIKIAKYFGVTIDYLLGASDAPYGEKGNYYIELAPEAEDERKMLNIYRLIKEKGGYEYAAKLLNMIEYLANEILGGNKEEN